MPDDLIVLVKESNAKDEAIQRGINNLVVFMAYSFSGTIKCFQSCAMRFNLKYSKTGVFKGYWTY